MKIPFQLYSQPNPNRHRISRRPRLSSSYVSGEIAAAKTTAAAKELSPPPVIEGWLTPCHGFCADTGADLWVIGVSWQVCDDVTVEDCRSLNNAGLGLHPGSGSQRPVIRNNVIQGCRIGLFWCWGACGGVAENCVLSENARYGVNFGHRDTDNVVRNCTVERNQAHDYGGGVYNGIFGTATISGTTVYSNTIPDWGYAGSGIYNKDGTLNIINSAISDNWIGDWAYGGGGIYNSGGTAHVANSTVSGNDAIGLNSGCGGIYNLNSGTVDITASAIVSNTSNFDSGGICNSGSGSVVTVTNSTISGNQTWCDGGGASNYSGTINLRHVTIVNNTADSDDNNYGQGGGIYRASGTVNLEHTIVAGNTVVISATHAAADCDGDVVSQGYNLVGSGTGYASDGTGDQTMNPAIVFTTVLGPLTDNGGDAWTHALLSGSPAIDAVPALSCTLPTDQRGEPRPQDGDLDGTAACDIGAYELVPGHIYLPLMLRKR